MALKKTRTFYLSRGGLLEVARDHPEVLLSMLATLSLRLRRFVGLIDDLSLKDVSARLAKFILEQASEQERATVSLNTTKAALASRLGTIAETISRTFRKLQEAGVIDVKGRSITILNEKTLRDIADGMKI
jgi:CRP-like cAMP-binding protein